jgi:hypothetical protein
VTDGELVLVVRGQQVPMTLLRAEPKSRDLSSAYRPRASAVKPSIAAQQPAEIPGAAPASEPEWSPPDLARLSRSTPAVPSGDGLPPAKTDLPTGRLVVECRQGPAHVYLDKAFVGLCPVDLPAIAGPHTVLVRRRGAPPWSHEFQLEAGQTTRLRAQP